MKDLEKRIEILEGYCEDLRIQNEEMSKLLGDFVRELRTLKDDMRSGGVKSPSPSFGENVFGARDFSAPIYGRNSFNSQNSSAADLTTDTVNTRNSRTASYGGKIVGAGNSAASFDINSILSEYNKIFEYSGNDGKIARENFAGKYNVVGISCSNYAERVNSPAIPVVFETTQSLAKAHIWIIDVKTKYYMAFLNPNKGYDEPTHEFAGMKDVFDSNYRDGAYNSFRLIRPAVFQNAGGTWKVMRKGEIRL